MPYSSISQYKENQVASASPEETVLMLYDGAINFLKSATRELNEHNNVAEKAVLIEKAFKIIEYLQSCLDKEKGGEISNNLEKLYEYVAVRLTMANLKNDVAKLEEVIELLSTIRDGWKDICKNKSPAGSVSYPEGSGADSRAAAGSGTMKVGLKA